MNNVLLDTSFLIRLGKETDPLHEFAWGYFNHFAENSIDMYVSTIATAEYSVKDDINNLPISAFKLLNFDLLDGGTSGKFAAQILQHSKYAMMQTKYGRSLVLNDIKMLAQCYNKKIEAIIAKDNEMKTFIVPNINELKGFKFIDLNVDPVVYFQKQLNMFPRKKP